MEIPLDSILLHGDLVIPVAATGMVVFAHGSGSSRFSSRNQYVARVLQQTGLGTLLFDLLTGEEERVDRATAALRFDIGLLADRSRGHRMLGGPPRSCGLPWVLRGQHGAAAALVAAARLPRGGCGIARRPSRPRGAVALSGDCAHPSRRRGCGHRGAGPQPTGLRTPGGHQGTGRDSGSHPSV